MAMLNREKTFFNDKLIIIRTIFVYLSSKISFLQFGIQNLIHSNYHFYFVNTIINPKTIFISLKNMIFKILFSIFRNNSSNSGKCFRKLRKFVIISIIGCGQNTLYKKQKSSYFDWLDYCSVIF